MGEFVLNCLCGFSFALVLSLLGCVYEHAGVYKHTGKSYISYIEK